MTTPFHHWVANTLQILGGNSTQYLCGVERECALTIAETRTAPCQGVFDIYFIDNYQGLTRDFAVVTTDKRWLH